MLFIVSSRNNDFDAFAALLRHRLANEALFIATTPLSVKHRLAISQLSIVVAAGLVGACSTSAISVLDEARRLTSRRRPRGRRRAASAAYVMMREGSSPDEPGNASSRGSVRAAHDARPRLLPGARPNPTAITHAATGGGRAGGAAGHRSASSQSGTYASEKSNLINGASLIRIS